MTFLILFSGAGSSLGFGFVLGSVMGGFVCSSFGFGFTAGGSVFGFGCSTFGSGFSAGVSVFGFGCPVTIFSSSTVGDVTLISKGFSSCPPTS